MLTELERPTVIACVFTPECEEVLVINQNYWDEPTNLFRLPQGGIHRDETPEDAAVRECEEEACLPARAIGYIATGFMAPQPEHTCPGVKRKLYIPAALLLNCRPDVTPNPQEHVRSAKFIPVNQFAGSTELMRNTRMRAYQRELVVAAAQELGQRVSVTPQRMRKTVPRQAPRPRVSLPV